MLFVFGFEGWIIFGLEDIFADPIFVFILFGPRVYKGYIMYVCVHMYSSGGS